MVPAKHVLRGRPRAQLRPCGYCHRQFKRMEHLQRHERIHTKERPFHCDCGQRFSRQDLLTRHRRMPHEGQQDCAEQHEPQYIAPNHPPTHLDFENLNSGSDVHEHAFRILSPVANVETTGGFASAAFPADEPYSLSGTQQPEQRVEATLPMHAPEDSLAATQGPQAPLDPIFGSVDTADFDVIWNSALLCPPFIPNGFLDVDLPTIEALPQGVVEPWYEQADAPASNTPQIGSAGSQSGPRSQHQSPRASPVPFHSRLPSLEPSPRLVDGTDLQHNGGFAEDESAYVRPWTVSAESYREISQNLDSFTAIFPSSFLLPSRHILSRYLEGYFRYLHHHLPFLHAPTFSAATVVPELLLALAAVGALYKFEHARGYRLYEASQAIVTWRLRQPKAFTLTRLTTTSPRYAAPGSSNDAPDALAAPNPHRSNTPTRGLDDGLQLLQALLVSVVLTSWGDGSLVSHSLAMSSQLSAMARDAGISDIETAVHEPSTWREWISHEERKRTLYVAYILTNLQCLVFNVPPLLPNQDIGLNLPGPTSAWKASNEMDWARSIRKEALTQYSFQKSLGDLLNGTPVMQKGGATALGNLLLMHGILQQIYFARYTFNCVPPSVEPLPTSFIERIGGALKTWQLSWEATGESTLDPLSSKGPLGFNSTALLRLAYVRLNSDTGTVRRHIRRRNAKEIAESFVNTELHLQTQSSHLDWAILQCIHSLSIPVRVGIAFVAHTQTLSWSVQHAFCTFECSLLLTHWILAMASRVETRGFGGLRFAQQKLLRMVASLVWETELRGMVDSHTDQAHRIRCLAAATARLWAEIYKSFHVFEIVHVIGSSMSIIADILQDRLKK
ncbi:fungal-specific transcription factor domain-containing protein [Aspergillus californicus]